jgi:hypothetical protein
MIAYIFICCCFFFCFRSFFKSILALRGRKKAKGVSVQNKKNTSSSKFIFRTKKLLATY